MKYIPLLLLLIFSCKKQNPSKINVKKIIVETKKDTLKIFTKKTTDICEVYGNINFVSIDMGLPHYVGENRPSLNQIKKRKDIYKLKFYSLTDSLIGEVKTDKFKKYQYKIKLKKETSYKIRTFIKNEKSTNFRLYSNNKFKYLKLKTNNKNECKYNVNSPLFGV